VGCGGIHMITEATSVTDIITWRYNPSQDLAKGGSLPENKAKKI